MARKPAESARSAVCSPARRNESTTMRWPFKYFDHLAIALSTVCIVHCLALPILIAVLPIVALTLGTGDSHFHALMLTVSLRLVAELPPPANK